MQISDSIKTLNEINFVLYEIKNLTQTRLWILYRFCGRNSKLFNQTSLCLFIQFEMDWLMIFTIYSSIATFLTSWERLANLISISNQHIQVSLIVFRRILSFLEIFNALNIFYKFPFKWRKYQEMTCNRIIVKKPQKSTPQSQFQTNCLQKYSLKAFCAKV